MPRRAQFALALILVLVLAPLAATSCGVRCLTAAPHRQTHSAKSQQPCLRAAACCHSTAPAICSATQLPDATAALLSVDSATAEAPVSMIRVAEAALQDPTRNALRTDSAPPGPPDGTRPIPLRI